MQAIRVRFSDNFPPESWLMEQRDGAWWDVLTLIFEGKIICFNLLPIHTRLLSVSYIMQNPSKIHSLNASSVFMKLSSKQQMMKCQRSCSDKIKTKQSSIAQLFFFQPWGLQQFDFEHWILNRPSNHFAAFVATLPSRSSEAKQGLIKKQHLLMNRLTVSKCVTLNWEAVDLLT